MSYFKKCCGMCFGFFLCLSRISNIINGIRLLALNSILIGVLLDIGMEEFYCCFGFTLKGWPLSQ